jgi:hypothetical protein
MQTKEQKAVYMKAWKAANKDKVAKHNKAYREANKEHLKEYMKQRYASNPEYKQYMKQYYKIKTTNDPKYNRAKHLKYSYGITIEQWNQMFINQVGCCAICGVHASETGRGIMTDHSHSTGKVRGLLCHSCNTTLKEANIGGFKATSELYTQALNYITIYNN